MLNLESVNKIAKRIKESKRFDEKWISHRIYLFDDRLTIERYNGLYRVEFKSQTLGHLHGRGDDEKLHDIIYYAIEDKKKELKNKAFEEL
jgi:hypothetical protein